VRNPIPWTYAALVFGLGLRLFYYLRNFSVWHDEAALIVNVLGKGFREQLGPLFLHEAAPPLFLWLERAVSRTLGDGPFALRLVSLLASCAALVLFVRLARRWLPAVCVPWAVLMFACSDRLLWHACEAKPYAVDVFLATLVLTLYSETRAWRLPRQILLYALLSPVLIFLAFPGCFLCGGLLAVLLPAVWRSGRLGTWLGYGAWSAVVAVSFLLLLTGPIRAQQDPKMRSCWTEMFPDWGRPWSVPGWVALSTADVVHYSCNPVGEYLAFLAIIGGVALWRRGERLLVALLALPWALALLAALPHAYPYGGARVLVYTSPAVVLLLAAGLPDTFAWLRRRAGWGQWLMVAMLALPPANTLYRLAVPWSRADASGAAAHVLAGRAADEAVFANAWEYLYYFRNDPRGLPALPGADFDPSRPLWVIVTTLKDADRRHLAEQLARGRAVLERREFELTTVLYLSGHNAGHESHSVGDSSCRETTNRGSVSQRDAGACGSTAVR
jgi:hypothetical protein